MRAIERVEQQRGENEIECHRRSISPSIGRKRREQRAYTVQANDKNMNVVKNRRRSRWWRLVLMRKTKDDKNKWLKMQHEKKRVLAGVAL